MRLMKRGSARAQSDTSGPDVVFSLLSQGSTAWCAFTRHHISRYVAIVLDGAVIIDPVVQQAICEPESQVSGVGSLERAREIAAYINTGPLPVPLSP